MKKSDKFEDEEKVFNTKLDNFKDSYMDFNQKMVNNLKVNTHFKVAYVFSTKLFMIYILKWFIIQNRFNH